MSTKIGKYFFATLVAVYLLTVVGMPVYLHYCGGEVEDISYLVETNGCCGDEEPQNDCCRNEGYVLQNNSDFTIKDLQPHFIKTVTQVFVLPRPLILIEPQTTVFASYSHHFPPPWQNSLLAGITVLRI